MSIEERIVDIMKRSPMADDGVGHGLMKRVAREIVEGLELTEEAKDVWQADARLLISQSRRYVTPWKRVDQ